MIKASDWKGGLGIFVPNWEMDIIRDVWDGYEVWYEQILFLLFLIVIRISCYICFPVAYIVGVAIRRHARLEREAEMRGYKSY